MRPFQALFKTTAAVFAFFALAAPTPSRADPSRYPQFAQQELPKDVKLSFISIDELAAEIVKGVKPLIIDVRSAEEFNEAHILGARSAPLANFRDYINSIPRDRLTILY
jgi:Rhodanese-like domain